MKRQLSLNYQELDKLAFELHQYYQAVLTIETIIDSNQSLLLQQKGVAFLALEESRVQLIQKIQLQKDILQEFSAILEQYEEDMEATIRPVIRTADVRLDTKDIWHSLAQIEEITEEIVHLRKSTTYANSCSTSTFEIQEKI